MRQLKITKSITNRSSKSLEKYLADIAKVDMISPDEEVELAKRIGNGDDAALKKLVNANLRFVVSVAKQYQFQGLHLADLINEGNLGLLKAAQRFDYTRGFKFISYAVWWIRQSILQALAEHSRVVRLPGNKLGTLHKINKSFTQLEQEFEREPTTEELAHHMQIPERVVKLTLKNAPRHISVDAPMKEDDNNFSMLSILEDKDSPDPDKELTYHESLRRELENIIDLLPETQGKVIKLYYGIGMKQKLSTHEISHQLGVTEDRIKQLRDKGIKQLRTHQNRHKLKSYLGS